jgi:hypothetical protein
MHRKTDLYSRNLRLARTLFGVGKQQILLTPLEHLSAMHFDIGLGDLALLNNHWYVSHTGLLQMAERKRCSGIHVEAVDSLGDSAANRFVLKATVYPSKDCAGFVGYGDADPANVSPLVRGAEMRVSADSVSGAHWIFFLVFDHLARAALCAISCRCSGESAAALASPPFLAPSLDKATACGFFFFSPMASRSTYASSRREKQYRMRYLTCLHGQAYACSCRH